MTKTRQKDNYFLKIALFFIIMAIAGLIFRTVYYPDFVNSEKINIITTLDNNQGYHPKIISFDKEWNGYKYWLAFTPYPKGDETKENPVVNASNDMLNWFIPTQSETPLDIPEISDSLHYNSDTHILYNEKLDQLELFWRYVDDGNNTVTIYKITSKDGKEWTEKEVFLFSENRKERDYVSPAIILEGDTYKIWYVDKKQVYYFEINGKTDNPKKLDIKYKNNYKSWHLDVIYNQDKEIYEMVICAYQDINHRENMNLYYTNSKDNLDWTTPIVIMTPSNSEEKWDSEGLYRSSLLYENNEYYLFYSGHDEEMNVGIGIMRGENIKKLKAYS